MCARLPLSDRYSITMFISLPHHESITCFLFSRSSRMALSTLLFSAFSGSPVNTKWKLT
jgi:hypothetical protein